MNAEIPAGTILNSLAAGGWTIPGKDGYDYRLRPIQQSDAESLIRGYDALSDRAKCFRMLHSVPYLTKEMAEAYCAPDPERDLCIVILGRGDLDGELLGGARITGARDGRSAEFSVSFRPQARGVGLARQALETVLRAAPEMGYERVWGWISSRNDPMLGLARRIGFAIRPDPDDASLKIAELTLRPLPV